MRNTYDTYQIPPERIAGVVAFAIDQPEDTTINEFTVGPANQPWRTDVSNQDHTPVTAEQTLSPKQQVIPLLAAFAASGGLV